MRDWSNNRPSTEPLYIKKEKEFLNQVEQLENQKRENELNHRKDVFKRISISEIRIHARKHDHIVGDKLSVLREKRKNEAPASHSENAREAANPIFSSKYLKNVINEEKLKKINDKRRDNEAKEKRNKASRFSKIVQEIYWSKERKLAERKLKLELSAKKRSNNRTKEDSLEKPKQENYIHYISQNNSYKNLKRKRKSPEKNKTMNESQSAVVKPPLRDYLKENRIKRKAEAKERLQSINCKCSRILINV